ncbi:polysaccharide biosynthesis/export family protein [Novosphingobium sp.]|uniref:polysaccharide biosynthesis/export family protein n=1 Tax=Novosphingobium sp. TaxID=1874826 RepID=UPI0033407B52
MNELSPFSIAPSHRPRRHALRGALLAGALALLTGGCSTVPVAGPMAPSLQREANEEAPPFLLVPVNRMTLTALGHVPADSFTPLAAPAPPPADTIHIGDTISVTLWEFGSGLLGPIPSIPNVGAAAPGLVGAQSATVPNQTVDQSGDIIVPFAGEIHAAGRTTKVVQNAIIAALKGKANQTQALVQIVRSSDNAVTVTGDVNRPGRVPLMRNGTRLLDAIAESGGTTGKARDMLVQLTRGGVVRNIRMADVMADPTQNIYLRGDDVLSLDHEPQTLVVLGAANKNTEVVFGKSRVTLAEAIGNGGGLADNLADPYGVYVLRYEKLVVARNLTTTPLPDYLQASDVVPVIYQLNFKSGDGLLLADSFVMRDRDLVYIATAPSVQVNKLAKMFGLVASIFKGNSSVNLGF